MKRLIALPALPSHLEAIRKSDAGDQLFGTPNLCQDFPDAISESRSTIRHDDFLHASHHGGWRCPEGRGHASGRRPSMKFPQGSRGPMLN